MSVIDKYIAEAAGKEISGMVSQQGAKDLLKHTITPKARFRRDVALESVGLMIAEGVSMATSLGVVAVADTLAPDMLKHASHSLAKTVVEPHLDTIERNMKRVCKLKECEPDPNMSRQERAERIAHTAIVFSASWAAGMLAKIQTRRGMNNAFNIPEEPKGKPWHISKKEFTILAADEGVHYGSLLAANTIMAEETDDMIRTNSRILNKMGVPPRKAHELASYAIIWELPNLLGMLSGLGAVYATHKNPARFGMTPG